MAILLQNISLRRPELGRYTANSIRRRQNKLR